MSVMFCSPFYTMRASPILTYPNPYKTTIQLKHRQSFIFFECTHAQDLYATLTKEQKNLSCTFDFKEVRRALQSHNVTT